MNSYVTTYCNRAHRKSDGRPIGHECRILPVEALKAEMDGDFERACDILHKTPSKYMLRGVQA